MSSNLPPGVTENMIPGNRPEDMEAEALRERIIEWLAGATHGLSNNCDEDKLWERVVNHMEKLCGEIYGEAYHRGRGDCDQILETRIATLEQAIKEARLTLFMAQEA